MTTNEITLHEEKILPNFLQSTYVLVIFKNGRTGLTHIYQWTIFNN